MTVGSISSSPELINTTDKEPGTKTKSTEVVEASIYIFKATEGESWTEVKLNFGFAHRTLYNFIIFPIVESFVKPKLDHKPEGWECIRKIDLGKIKTVGELDKHSTEILQKTMDASHERCAEIEKKVKAVLKCIAEHGIFYAKDSIIDLVKNP